VVGFGVDQKNNRKSLLLSALVLFAVNVLNFYDRHVPGALTEPIRKEFHLTDTQIGLLGSAFIWVYALVDCHSVALRTRPAGRNFWPPLFLFGRR